MYVLAHTSGYYYSTSIYFENQFVSHVAQSHLKSTTARWESYSSCWRCNSKYRLRHIPSNHHLHSAITEGRISLQWKYVSVKLCLLDLVLVAHKGLSNLPTELEFIIFKLGSAIPSCYLSNTKNHQNYYLDKAHLWCQFYSLVVILLHEVLIEVAMTQKGRNKDYLTSPLGSIQPCQLGIKPHRKATMLSRDF